jgi:hypothetical protein
VARWTSAVLVFAVLGGAATYAVTRPERTKIPGLKTRSDGRWVYPPLALPKLPAGKARPLSQANPAGVHYADEHALLLPPPTTARPDRSFPSAAGWLPADTYLKRFSYDGSADRSDARDALTDDALRHIAARAWTMPDGTRTEVYLLQFITAGYRSDYGDYLADVTVAGAPEVTLDTRPPPSSIPVGTQLTVQSEDRPYGATATRYAYIGSGDTLGLVVQTRKGSVAEVPFEQTVRLQAQLLG